MLHFNNKKVVRALSQWYLCFLLFAVSGCAVLQPQPTKKNIQSRASVPQLTQTHEELTSLPNPRGVLRAAVYSFRDYTGQYKPQPSNGLSTAVTQGADSILLNVLLDSKWFCLLYTSPSPRDRQKSRMPSSA